MNGRLNNLLLKSLDSELLPHERSELESALSTSEALQHTKEELLRMRATLRTKSEISFASGFEERVMNRITALSEDALASGLFTIFRPVAIVAAALIIILASINMATSEQISVHGIFAVTEVAPQDAFNPLVDLVQE
jgi:anti-sigma factor RsiW